MATFSQGERIKSTGSGFTGSVTEGCFQSDKDNCDPSFERLPTLLSHTNKNAQIARLIFIPSSITSFRIPAFSSL